MNTRKPTVENEARAMGFSPEAAALLGAFAKATKRRKTAQRRKRIALQSAGQN